MTDGQAQVVIPQEGGFWRDRLRRYKVHLDRQLVGKLRENEEVSVAVQPGRHDVQAKLDWGSSPKLRVRLRAGEVARLRCSPGSLLGLVVPEKYLHLEADDGSTRPPHWHLD